MDLKKVKQIFDPLLKANGLKSTNPRLLFLHFLDKAKSPLSATEMQEILNQYDVNLATIYRTIESLLEVNIIRTVNLRHDHNHYELVKTHHHHAICESCGKVVDISECDLTNLQSQIKKMANFKQINSHALEFFGICNECFKK